VKSQTVNTALRGVPVYFQLSHETHYTYPHRDSLAKLYVAGYMLRWSWNTPIPVIW